MNPLVRDEHFLVHAEMKIPGRKDTVLHLACCGSHGITWVAKAALPARQIDLEALRDATCLVLKAIFWYEAGHGPVMETAAGAATCLWQSARRTCATVRVAILILDVKYDGICLSRLLQDRWGSP